MPSVGVDAVALVPLPPPQQSPPDGPSAGSPSPSRFEFSVDVHPQLGSGPLSDVCLSAVELTALSDQVLSSLHLVDFLRTIPVAPFTTAVPSGLPFDLTMHAEASTPGKSRPRATQFDDSLFLLFILYCVVPLFM